MKPEDLPVFPASGQLAEAAEQGLLTLRVRAADALLTHYEMTHGNVGEHDHHCPCVNHEDHIEGYECTCGWTVAQWAISVYERAQGRE